jgi:hypothetical protein
VRKIALTTPHTFFNTVFYAGSIRCDVGRLVDLMQPSLLVQELINQSISAEVAAEYSSILLFTTLSRLEHKPQEQANLIDYIYAETACTHSIVTILLLADVITNSVSQTDDATLTYVCNAIGSQMSHSRVGVLFAVTLLTISTDNFNHSISLNEEVLGLAGRLFKQSLRSGWSNISCMTATSVLDFYMIKRNTLKTVPSASLCRLSNILAVLVTCYRQVRYASSSLHN